MPARLCGLPCDLAALLFAQLIGAGFPALLPQGLGSLILPLIGLLVFDRARGNLHNELRALAYVAGAFGFA